jgi:hypothetical protein
MREYSEKRSSSELLFCIRTPKFTIKYVKYFTFSAIYTIIKKQSVY